MRKIPFTHSPTLSLGVEVELQLTHPQTRDLCPKGPAILESIGKQASAHSIKSEIFQSMLEINTPIYKTAHEAGHHLREALQVTRNFADEHGANILMAGTHPIARYSERSLTDESRYHTLLDRNQWLFRRLQIFGTHVHIGMRDGEHAVAMSNALCHYLPLILAFSASSPFWSGQDTGLASSRTTIFEAIPTGGHPYAIRSWTEFEIMVDRMIHSRSITALKDLWWDIRPSPEFGTLEIRIADCSPTLAETEALVALIHALAIRIDEDLRESKRFEAPPDWIYRENKWRASRHGEKADLIHDSIGTTLPFQTIWERTKAYLADTILKHDYQKHINLLDSLLIQGPSYVRQRRAFEQGGFEAIVDHLVAEGISDSPR